MLVFVRSLLFNVFGFTFACVTGALILLAFFLPYRFRSWICRMYCEYVVWSVGFFCGIKVEVEGRENIPDEPSVIMIKHTSTLETLWQVTAFPQTAWVLKREILYAPFFGWAIGLGLRPIAIDRSAAGSAVKQVIRQGKQKLADGVWVTVFPEGTRMPPGETRRYGVSGAALARDAGALIVPVAHNAGDFWGRRAFAKQPGVVKFVIGPPIDASAQSPKETNLIVQAWVEARMNEISSIYQEKARLESAA